MKTYEATPSSRPAPDQNFNSDLATYAGTRGAPSLPQKRTYAKIVNVTRYRANFMDEIIKFIRETNRADGMILAGLNILTHKDLINALEHGNCAVVVDKFRPTLRFARAYNNLVCYVRRNQLPGNCFAHLSRRDGQNDYGMIDAVRLVGDFRGSRAPLRENETSPLMHLKHAVRLLPGKGGKYIPTAAIRGTANWTRNAENSIEEIEIVEDPHYALHTYEYLAYVFSISEGLWHWSRGITPTYHWEERKVKYKNPGKCMVCGSSILAPWWHIQKHTQEKVLACGNCHEIIPSYLEHNIPNL